MPKPETKAKLKIPSSRSEDQPATRKMLTLVRDELKSEIRSLDRKIDARFSAQDAKFAGIDARFSAQDAKFAKIDERFARIDERFAKVDERFSMVDSKLDGMHADIQRIAFLVEDQNANNRIVLEGLQALWQRQDRIEKNLASR